MNVHSWKAVGSHALSFRLSSAQMRLMVDSCRPRWLHPLMARLVHCASNRPGVYVLTARAFDTKGFMTVSEPVRVRVSAANDSPIAEIALKRIRISYPFSREVKQVGMFSWLLIVLLVTGCPGPPLSTVRSVAVVLPPTTPADTAPAADPQVQEALRLVDSILSSNGYVREPSSTSPVGEHFPISYVRRPGNGPGQSGMVGVYLKSGKLEVVITELGNRTGRLRANSELLDSLRRQLGRKFGVAHVTISKSFEH